MFKPTPEIFKPTPEISGATPELSGLGFCCKARVFCPLFISPQRFLDLLQRFLDLLQRFLDLLDIFLDLLQGFLDLFQSTTTCTTTCATEANKIYVLLLLILAERSASMVIVFLCVLHRYRLYIRVYQYCKYNGYSHHQIF